MLRRRKISAILLMFAAAHLGIVFAGFFAPYAPWGALAGAYALRAGADAGPAVSRALLRIAA